MKVRITMGTINLFSPFKSEPVLHIIICKL